MMHFLIFFKLENKNLRLSQYLRIGVFKPRCIYGGGAGVGGYEPHIAAKEITSINCKLCERLNQGNKNKHLLSICHLNHSLGDLSTQALYLTLDWGQKGVGTWGKVDHLRLTGRQRSCKWRRLQDGSRKNADRDVDLFPANSMSKMTKK